MAEYYLSIKSIHMTTALISIALFGLRYVWMLMDSRHLQARWVKILPHVNDTILLVSAIFLAITISQYPFVHHWLTAKVIALVVYIVLGTIAIKRGRSKGIRTTAGALAIITFPYILHVATSKQPLPF